MNEWRNLTVLAVAVAVVSCSSDHGSEMMSEKIVWSAPFESPTLEDWDLLFEGPGTGILRDTSDAPGGRASLRFGPLKGRATATSASFPLSSQRTYQLEFRIKIEGDQPWHWNYFPEFTGARLSFFDEQQALLDQIALPTHALRTDGWVRVVRQFQPPKGARAGRISFEYFNEAKVDGWFSVDEVIIREAPDRPSGDEAAIEIRVVDAETGAPTFARLSVVDEAGNSYAPDDGHVYESPEACFFPARREGCRVTLPTGRVTVTARRGYEFRPVTKVLNVLAGETTELTITLRRAFDWSAKGWYAGDHHQHLFFHKHTRYPFMTPKTVMDIAQAEGLSYLSFQAEENEFREAVAGGALYRGPDFVGSLGLEVVNDFWGHVCTVNVTRLFPGEYPLRLRVWPMNLDVIEEHASSTAHILTHPQYATDEETMMEQLADPNVLLTARELPILLALGQPVCVELLYPQKSDDLEAKLATCYRLLNLGFPLGLTGCSDVYADQGAMIPSSPRTYVRADSLDMNAIAAGYRRGATFATNGPLIDFTVDGAGIGDTVEVEGRDARVHCRLEGAALTGLRGGEIVVNGRVVERIDADGEGRISWEGDLLLDGSAWIAARVYGGAKAYTQTRCVPESWLPGRGKYAHTSPVYVIADGAPILAASPEDADYFIRWLDATGEALRELLKAGRTIYGDLTPERQLARALPRLRQARRVFQKRLDGMVK